MKMIQDHSQIALITLIGAFLALCSPLQLSAQPSSQSNGSMYQKDLAPLLTQYCGACHGTARGRGGISFIQRPADGGFARDTTFWPAVLRVLEDRTMPENADRLNFTEIERQKIIRLVWQGMRNPDVSQLPKDPGPAPFRLLTQFEYGCTLRDLLGVTDVPLTKLPSDAFAASPGAQGGAATAENGGISAFVLSRYLTVAEDIADALPRERFIKVEPSDKVSPREAAEQSLKPIEIRAFRRPLAEDDIPRLMALFDRVQQLNKPFDETMRITLTGILASPKFLTHVEQPIRGNAPGPIDQYDLANRLSYFIWSSLPDVQLIELAAAGKLADPATIEQQAKRMLAEDKARALSENFGLRWLGLANLRPRTAPNAPASAPGAATQPSNRAITAAQITEIRQQAIGFLDGIFRQDKSLLTLIDDPSGGVLGLRGVQVATAASGIRTSPPHRGKWVLETLLGDRVSPGLYDSCRIDKGAAGLEGAPLRVQLEAARQQAQCSMCHERIDAPGFALEGFDAFGNLRPGEGDLASLRGSILSRKDELVRTVVERMLAYSLGRAIEPCDRPTVLQISKTLAENNYRASLLITEIAKSYPFNYRRPIEE